MNISTNVSAGPDAGGTGTNVEAVEFRGVVVGTGETIVKGDLVTFYKASATMDGVLVFEATSAKDFVCGVAQHDATAGQPLLIQTQGLGQVDIVTDESCEEGYGLYASATAGAASGQTIDGSADNCLCGYVLANDDDATLAAGEYVLNCWF